MLFSARITIPADTAKDDPTEQILQVAHGIITKIMVRPRPGHAGLAHVVVLFHEQQIAPSSPDMDISGDAFPVDWDEYYELREPPYELKLRGWNDDDSYAHTFDIYVVVLPRRAVPGLAISDFIKGLLGPAPTSKAKAQVKKKTAEAA